MIRRRKKEENKHRMKEGTKEISIYDKNENKYSEKFLIRLSERKNNLNR
jgi:hypothetical protein